METMGPSRTLRRTTPFQIRHQRPDTTGTSSQRILSAIAARHVTSQVAADSSEEPAFADLYIAVMGMTGVGKSTFISKCTDEEVIIGRGMQSCESRTCVYEQNLTAILE